MYELDLGQFGAEGFTLRERIDLTGHGSGRVDPHENTELVNPYNQVIQRDLSNNQIPGMNGMQY